MISRKKATRSIAAAIALAGALLMTCGNATAQDTASIVILPSATPSASDQVVVRITYAMAQCGNFAPPTVTREPGGVIRLRVTPVRPAIPVPSCVVTFDVNLGMLPEGNYYVLFEPGNAGVLATASFWVGFAPIPAISEWGVAILAILIAVLAAVGGVGAERKAVFGRRQLGLMLAGWLTLVGTPDSASAATAAEVAPRATRTDLIVRFDRRAETRSVPVSANCRWLSRPRVSFQARNREVE